MFNSTPLIYKESHASPKEMLATLFCHNSHQSTGLALPSDRMLWHFPPDDHV